MKNYINYILKSIQELIKKKKAKQIGSLYLSMIFSIVLGIAVSVVNTRLLGPKQYGDLKFLQNLFNFVVLFLTIGLFVSGSRLLALKENEKIKNQIFGSLSIVAAVMSVALILLLFGFSFFEDEIFNNELGSYIRIFSPLLFVFPFQLFLQNVMQGDNRIYELAVFQTLPKILYLIAAISFNYFVPLSLPYALGIQLLVIAILVIIFTIRLKPQYNDLKRNFSIIWQENKTYGFHDYIGTIVGTASASLGGLSIGYFINTTNVGYFSLAVAITGPLLLIPNAVGKTFYKDFANKTTIPKKTTILTITLSFIALILLLLIIKKVIVLLYSVNYLPVVQIAYIVSFGNIFHGFGDYITRFMAAHGKGKELRNSAIIIGVFNIAGYSFLVYFFGITGAALTKLFSGIVYFLIIGYYYKRYVSELKYNNIN